MPLILDMLSKNANAFHTFLELTMIISFLRMCWFGFRYHCLLETLLILYTEMLVYRYYDVIDKMGSDMMDYLSQFTIVQKMNTKLLDWFNSLFISRRSFKTKISEKPVFTNPTAKHPAVKQEADWCPDVIDLTDDSQTKLDRRHSD